MSHKIRGGQPFRGISHDACCLIDSLTFKVLVAEYLLPPLLDWGQGTI
jgi:hypothetical protein